MPETINTVHAHLDDTIRTGGLPSNNKLFNLSKNSKDDAPITGFIEYYAYKIEERKHNLHYPNAGDKDGSVKKDWS